MVAILKNEPHSCPSSDGHVDSTYLHIKVQPTTTATSYIIVKYVPETNMLLKPHMQITLCTHETTMSVCISYMSSLQSVM